jgi:methionyl-tRNA formyltransferase
MKIDEELDHGDIIVQKEIEIDKKDTTESLLFKLNNASVPLLLSVLETIEKTNVFPQAIKQDHRKATFTKKITKQDGFIPFEELRNALQIPSEQSIKIHNKIRGFYPWPGAWTTLPNGKRLKLISSEIKDEKLILKEIQLEGKQKTNDLNFLKEFLKN